MANFVFNESKGRIVEFYRLIENNIIAAACFRAVPLSASGTEAQGQDLLTMSAVEADANFAERTTGGWVRKQWGDTQLAAFPAADTANNRYDVSVPATTWTTPAAGNNTTGLLICMDLSGSDADGVLLPCTHHDFAVTTDGNDVVLNAGVFLRAT